ncbi:hypothetical protein HPB49_017814 [Dermacentor silvarum]|uniref:Uncharacterized protein n=1 Tax=Dermacentor silvarum TaxID=543639 RepID=A0ACB8CAR9_DERSI|nr:hypothetical protein HPB49_017814 [Dermacentor silvarum]
MEEQTFEYALYPHPLQYTYETFYLSKYGQEMETVFFAVLNQSQGAFLFLLITMLGVWAALSLGDCVHFGAVRTESMLDAAMFLVASFLATSTPVDTQVRGYTFNVHSARRTAILSAWMLGILPLSAFYRSELTSRLSVQVPPDHVDTLEELEAALDKSEIEPCIVRDGCLHALAEGQLSHGNRSLDLKLKEAFNRRPNGSRRVFDYQRDCLECAGRRGFACFLCGLGYCDLRKTRRNYVQSKDSLNIALVTTPVRKGYRLAQPYRQFLQRLFETALRPFSHKGQYCLDANSRPSHFDNIDIKEEISQVFGLSAFFTIFLSLMCVAFIVFCFELTLGCHLASA